MKNYEERIIVEAIEDFGGHDATYSVGLSGINVLDFRRPGTGAYALRVVFDNQRGGRVYISGDLGEAVVYPTCAARLEDLAECFTRRRENGTIAVNWGYFLEKVRATSDRWCWHSARFWEDFKEHCDEDLLDGDAFIEAHQECDWDFDVEIDHRNGVTLSGSAKEELHDIDPDFAGWVYDCGKRVSPRVILWLVALRLAYEAVEKAREEAKGGAE